MNEFSDAGIDNDQMYPKPVIGIVGGIGSGKSSVAAEFARMGCLVIDSDRLAHQVLEEPGIRQELQILFGPTIVGTDGKIDRSRLGSRVFRNPEDMRKLNSVVHPRVEQQRRDLMDVVRNNDRVNAVVLDSPLLVETGLDRQCDAIIYVDVPLEIRQKRVLLSRGWDAVELARRENIQMTLDKKEKIAHYIIVNVGEPALLGSQVREVLTLVLARFGRINNGKR
ncbi:MAG: dephospho-CoA kinase [Phycisphaerae bacterium]